MTPIGPTLLAFLFLVVAFAVILVQLNRRQRSTVHKLLSMNWNSAEILHRRVAELRRENLELGMRSPRVKLPARRHFNDGYGHDEVLAWNACIEEMKSLNAGRWVQEPVQDVVEALHGQAN